MPKYHPCKVGTIPAIIHLRYHYRIRVGLRIEYRMREHDSGGWQEGWIYEVHDDGYFKVRHSELRE